MPPDTSLPVEAGLVRTLLNGEFAVTAELTPPLSASSDDLLDKALPFRGIVDAVNVTDGAGARAHLSNVAAAGLMMQHGIEPVLQFTCRDRNRIALQSDLLGAGAFGVRNVMILGGDDPKQGDQPDAKPVFDLDTGAFIDMARQMRDDGTILSGREIASPPDLFIGAADTPIDPEPGWTPERLLAKAASGAQFVQTQFCFDAGIVERYIERLRDHGATDQLFVLMGIGPIRSVKSARWMRENLWGVIIPDEIVDRLDQADDERAEGRRVCVELIQQFREIDGIAGVHIMAIRQEETIPVILAEAGIGPTHRDEPAPAAAH